MNKLFALIALAILLSTACSAKQQPDGSWVVGPANAGQPAAPAAQAPAQGNPQAAAQAPNPTTNPTGFAQWCADQAVAQRKEIDVTSSMSSGVCKTKDGSAITVNTLATGGAATTNPSSPTVPSAPDKPAATDAKPAPGAGAQASGCMLLTQVQQLRTDAKGAFASFLTNVNKTFDNPNVSQMGRDITDPAAGYKITASDRMPAGNVMLLTDTAHNPFKALDGKPLNTTVFQVIGRGSWGGYILFGDVESPTPGRLVSVCDKITDMNAAFPGFRTSENGVY